MGAAGEILRKLAADEFREDLAKFQDDELEFMLAARIAALQSELAKYRRVKKREVRKARAV